MEVSPRQVSLALAAIVALLVILGVPSLAAAEPDGPKLAFVGTRPIKVTFDGNVARFGVTVRNDSDHTGKLTVHLALDSGPDIKIHPNGAEVQVGSEQVRLTLLPATETPFTVRPRDAARLRLDLKAEPVPKQSVAGVLVISASAKAQVTPLTATIRIARPKSPTPKPPFANARVAPDSIIMVIRRKVPSFWPGSADDEALTGGSESAKVEGVGPQAGRTPAASRQVDVFGDTGGRGTLHVTIPAIDAKATTAKITVDPQQIPRHGTYESVIALDETAKEPRTVTVKVIAGDSWVYALIALLLGACLALALVHSGQMVRPKRVLQLALTRAQARNVANVKAVGAKALAMPYVLDHLFPTGDWDCGATGSDPEALALYCAIDRAGRQEELDALATQVADLEARVNAWPSVCAKADALNKAINELQKHTEAAAIIKASQALSKRDSDIPADEGATKAYMESLDDQVKATREWLNAEALFDEALRLFQELGDAPREHDPARWRADLRAAKSLPDLERCHVVAGLCRDVHVLRTLALERDKRARSLLLIQPEESADEPGLEFISIEAAPPALPGPDLTKYLINAIGTSDRVTFAVTTAVVAVAYLAGVYTDTYGSVTDYLTAFAAGAGATFAANWKLLPWYSSYKPPKATPAPE